MQGNVPKTNFLTPWLRQQSEKCWAFACKPSMTGIVDSRLQGVGSIRGTNVPLAIQWGIKEHRAKGHRGKITYLLLPQYTSISFLPPILHPLFAHHPHPLPRHLAWFCRFWETYAPVFVVSSKFLPFPVFPQMYIGISAQKSLFIPISTYPCVPWLYL